MALTYLTQGGSQDLDLSSDGFTDTFRQRSTNSSDLQIVRNPIDDVGNPIFTFQISNDGISWSDWWVVEGFIWREDTYLWEFKESKQTFFRLSWLSNSSTGTFTANFKTL